jgi:two-component system probable response regulator PhcQ
MLNQQAEKKCGVLYIDDEELALKYFRLDYSGEYEVFTAASGAEGLELLRREADRIGIILSDQKMPGMQGAEVLAAVREEFPSKVRILVTAYSDLQSAIAAVNQGHIYQYVSKPWEKDDLVILLRRAADYYHVLAERNELLALKMSTLQRLICGDRLKWLLLLEPGANGSADAFRGALSSLVAAMPESLESARSMPRNGYNRADFEIGALVRAEYETSRQSIAALQAPPAAEISAELPPALRESLAPLPPPAGAALGEFLVELIRSAGVPAAQIAFHAGSPLRITLRAVSPEPILRTCFGLLVEKQVTPASLAFVRALVALQQTGLGSLEIDAQELQLEFPAGPIQAEEILDALYKKFSTWDIFRL